MEQFNEKELLNKVQKNIKERRRKIKECQSKRNQRKKQNVLRYKCNEI